MDRSNPGNDIRIDMEGDWFYRGVKMTRKDIVLLFGRHLEQDASGGYFIRIGPQIRRVEVEDTPFVVRAVYRADACGAGGDALDLLLSDDSLEPLNPGTLRIGKNCIPYCKIKNGSFDARFSRSGYYQLAEHIKHDPYRDAFFISLNGQAYYLCPP